MQMKKRVLSAFMALCMVCSLVGAAWAVIPQQTSAAANFVITDTVSEDGQFTVTGGNGGDYTYRWSRALPTTETQDPQNIQIWTEVERTRVSGSLYNLTEDGQSVNVALDAKLAGVEDDQRLWYRVEVIDAEGTTVATLYQRVPYYIELQNGGFETPDRTQSHPLYDYANGWKYMEMSGPNLNFVGQDDVKLDYDDENVIWKTTDTRSLIEIIRPGGERKNSGVWPWDTEYTYTGTYGTHGVNEAPEGSQIAELNAESEGTLYQDVLTVPGSTLNWSLLHRPRNRASDFFDGYDTMFVVIMSAEQASAISSQDEVRQIIQAAGFDPTHYYENRTNGEPDEKSVASGKYQGAVVWRITDYIRGSEERPGADSWTRYVDSYTVPDDQYMTRFFFASGPTAYTHNKDEDNYTVGNLLDNVAFTADVLEPNPGTANITVTKTVNGLSDEELQNYTAEFSIKNGDEEVGKITLNNFGAPDAEGNSTVSGTATISLDDKESMDVTVTETLPTGVDNYTVTTTSSSGTVSGDASIQVTLTDQQTTAVTFTNTYQQLEPLTPEHNKYIKDNGDGTYDLSLNVTGTISESTEKIPINVLYVLDESYSMMWDMNGTYPGGSENDGGDDPEYANEYSFERYKAAVAAITELNNTLAENNSLNVQVALVPFAREAYTNEIVNWQELNADNVADFNSTKLPEAVWETFASGTNYYDALTKAQQLVADPPENGGETIVIFVTDGEPNWPREDGIHEDLVYAQNQAEVAASQLTCDRFYAIGVGDDQFEQNLKDLVTAIDKNNVPTSAYFKSSNQEDLVNYFKNIAADITSVDCTNVVITDTLSQWAELVNESAAPQITLVNSFTNDTRDVDVANVTEEENGTYTCTGIFTDGSGERQTLTYTYNSDTKTFTLEFPDTYALENGWTYTITVKIQPTEGAYQYYATNNSYPNTGEENTDAPGNDTSSGKPGFYSNTEANLTYDSNGVEDVKEEYPKPVIQVKLGDLTLAKQVNGLENGDNANDVSFTFTVTGPKTAVGYQDFTAGVNNTATKQVTVTPGNPVTLNNLPYGTYTVTENDPANEIVNEKYYFVGSSSTATNNQVTVGATNATATITNTYAPYRTVTITKDVGGNMGVTDYPFNFTTKVNGTDIDSTTVNTDGILEIDGRKIEISFTGDEETATLTKEGYTLADGDTITISKLKDGDVITLKETDGNSNGYTTVYKISETELSKDNDGNATHTVAGDANIIVTNERNVGTPTGFFEDNLPFTLMISAAGLAGIALIATILVRRQRRRRE